MMNPQQPSLPNPLDTNKTPPQNQPLSNPVQSSTTLPSYEVDALIAQQTYGGWTEQTTLPITNQHRPARQAVLILTAVAMLIAAGSLSFWAIQRSREQSRVTDLNQSSTETTAITSGAAQILADESALSDADNMATEESTVSEPAASATPVPSNTSGQTSTPSQKPVPAKTTSKAVSVSCEKNGLFRPALSSSIISQAETSIEQAVQGQTAKLTSWVPLRYQTGERGTEPASVDKSFKGLEPISCSVFPTTIRKKNQYSQSGASLVIRFKDKRTGKLYITTANISLVGNTWKTDRMSIAQTK